MRVRASRVLVHLRRQWMGALALFLVLTGGVAYAANTVFSTDIVNNEVYGSDVRDDTLAYGGLGRRPQARLGGIFRGCERLDPRRRSRGLGAGARAFALVRGASCENPVAFCTLLRSKRVAYAVHVGEGKFCVGVDGISAAGATSLPLVAPTVAAGDSLDHWAYRWGRLPATCNVLERSLRSLREPGQVWRTTTSRSSSPSGTRDTHVVRRPDPRAGRRGAHCANRACQCGLRPDSRSPLLRLVTIGERKTDRRGVRRDGLVIFRPPP